MLAHLAQIYRQRWESQEQGLQATQAKLFLLIFQPVFADQVFVMQDYPGSRDQQNWSDSRCQVEYRFSRDCLFDFPLDR